MVKVQVAPDAPPPLHPADARGEYKWLSSDHIGLPPGHPQRIDLGPNVNVNAALTNAARHGGVRVVTSVVYGFKMEPAAAAALLERCRGPQLAHVNLRALPVSADHIVALAQASPNIEVLDTNGKHDIGFTTFLRLCAMLPRLKFIDLRETGAHGRLQYMRPDKITAATGNPLLLVDL